MIGKFKSGQADLSARMVSAVVLAPVVLGAAWQGGVAFQILIIIVILLSAYEWCRVTCGPVWMIDFVIIAGTALCAQQLAIMPGPMGDTLRSGYVIGAIITGMALAGGLGAMQGLPLKWRLIGAPYISLGPAAVIWLRAQPDIGLALTVWLLLIIWAMDSGAYFAGRAIGGPKLAPRASPNKTWSGLLGGMLSAGVVGGIVAAVTELAPVLQLGLMSALIGGWSQVGDIAESMVKRHFGVKDMSNLIPGHGGILDRIDGLLFAAPAMAAAVALLLSAGT